MIKKLPLVALCSVIVSSFFLYASASAINYGGIGGRPVYSNPSNPRTQSIFIFTLKPGQSGSNAVEVQNDTNQTQTIAVDAVDSELATGGQFTCKQAVEPKTDVGAWINLQSTSVTVPANSTRDVPFTVTVPDSNTISVGEHDGCITLQASSQTAAPSNKNGIVLSFRTAIRVVVTIPGKLVKKLGITSVKVANGSDGSYLVTPSIDNQGNVSLDAKLHLQLLSFYGASSQTVDEGTMPVLPQSSMVSSYDLNHPFWGGFYVARATVSYNDDPNTGLGLQDNSNQKILVMDSAVFFATPKPLAAIIEIIVLLAVVLALYWLIRTRKFNRQVNTSWEKYIVKHGDTLEKLAERTGVSWKKLAVSNKIKAPYTLTEKQTIKLPPKPKD